MEQFDSSGEENSRVLEQQQRNDEQQCPGCAAELTEISVWTTGRPQRARLTVWADQISKVALLLESGHLITKFSKFEINPLPDWKPVQAP